MKTTSLINVMPSNKAQVIDFVKQTKDVIMSGNENPLKIAVQLRALEDVIKQLRTDSQIQDYTLSEAQKESVKTFKVFGAEITIKETGVKYDYSSCNDSELQEMNQELDELKAQIKERETMLKNIGDGFIVNQHGEELTAPLKTSKTGISIRLL